MSTSCASCQHYVGSETFSEDGDRRPMLVCGMHPYGPESEACEDWEEKAIAPPRLSENVMMGIAAGVSPWAREISAEAMRQELSEIRARRLETMAHHRLQSSSFDPRQVNHQSFSWAEELGLDPNATARALRAFSEPPLHPNCRCFTRWEYPFSSNSRENHWRTDPLQIFGMREKWGKAFRRAIARALRSLSNLIAP